MWEPAPNRQGAPTGCSPTCPRIPGSPPRSPYTSPRPALGRRMPPTRRRRPADLRRGLVGMQPQRAQGVGPDANVVPSAPTAVGAWTAGVVPVDVALREGHPVDAAIT